MKACKFRFDDSPIYDGFAYGSTWNGFDNVAITKDTRDRIIADFLADGAGDDTADQFREIEPDEKGLISLGWGFATSIVK
jgi:hypothetical protein